MLIWGSTWAAIRVSVQGMPILRSVALRFDIAAAVLAIMMVLFRPRLPTRSEWKVLFLFSLFTMVVPFTLVAWSSNHTTSSLTAILFATTPVVVAAMEHVLALRGKGQPLSFWKAAGLGGGLVGIILILCSIPAEAHLEMKGVFAILLVVAIGSYASIRGKRELQAIPALTSTTVITALAGLMMSLGSLALESKQPTHWSLSTIKATLFLGLFSSALGHTLYIWLLRHLRPYQLDARYFLMPLVAMAEGKYILGEIITPMMVGGMLLIFSGLVPILKGAGPSTGSPEPIAGEA